jgi:hypothetical protein
LLGLLLAGEHDAALASVTRVVELMGRDPNPSGRPRLANKKTLEKIWTRFGSVAHFHAAEILAHSGSVQFEGLSRGTTFFEFMSLFDPLEPFALAPIGSFLLVSEALRQKAAPNRKNPWGKKRTTDDWTVPEMISDPAMEVIQFGLLDFNEKELLELQRKAWRDSPTKAPPLQK